GPRSRRGNPHGERQRARHDPRSGGAAVTPVAALSLAGAGALLWRYSPNFQALTIPPPTKTAKLHDANRTIEVSKSVALNFECNYQGVPCTSAKAEVDDSKIATVMPAFVDALSPAIAGGSGRTRGAKPRAVFVVLGVAEGKTTLSVKSDDGD